MARKGMDKIVRDMEFKDLKFSGADAIKSCETPEELYKVLVMLRADCMGLVDHATRVNATQLTYSITE